MNQYDVALSFAMNEVDLVRNVYHYLRAEGLKVFFSPECQSDLSGKNQREVFYSIFGLSSKMVVLFVSENYIVRDVPMEEAQIAISKLGKSGRVIPIYLDEARLPKHIFDPKSYNYFQSSSAAVIANHISEKIILTKDNDIEKKVDNTSKGSMNNTNNHANSQIFINNLKL